MSTHRLPQLGTTISYGNIILAIGMVLSIGVAYSSLDSRVSVNTERMISMNSSLSTINSRMRILEASAVKSEVKLVQIHMLLEKQYRRIEMLAVRPQ